MKSDNQSFLDTRTLLAVLLVGVTFVGWQAYMQKKYPDANKTKSVAQSPTSPTAATPAEPTATTGKGESANVSGTPETAPRMAEKTIHYQSDTLSFDISSRGMGIKAFQIVRFKNRGGEMIELGHAQDDVLALQTRLLGRNEPVDFQIEQLNPNLFVGRAQLGNIQITKTMQVVPEKYLLEFKVVASGQDDRFIGLTTALSEEVNVPEKEGFFSSGTTGKALVQAQKQEFYVDTAESKDREVFSADVQKSWSRVKIASLGSQYFTQAVLDKSSVIPEAKGHVNHAKKIANITLEYPSLNRAGNFELDYLAFVGPKSLSLLRNVDENLARVVDFGFFNWIGRHILELLKGIFGVVGNWGIAIICLTLIVRLLVLPINIYSYKSMRAMQAIQPQMQALRERFKDDQQKQQQEIMALMKTNKVNPVSGCLPVLAQFPIFIALYQVLGNSVELYQAPFGMWIHDLSLKDPFYILPVLMGLTMFVQQKITPTNMDPAQAKVLLMMPLLFTFFMVSLPSGLTLYMLVGALFSVLQQTYFMRQTKTLSSVTR